MTDIDISNDSISTEVVRRENGVDSCTLTANDADGANYLNTFVMGQSITVRYAYEEDNPGDWSSIKPVFRGTVQEINPSMSKAGEIANIVAYGQAYPLKLMRVTNEYGYQSISNPSISTMKAIIQDLIDKYVNHVLGSSTSSGWSLNTDYVYNPFVPPTPVSIPYIKLPYTDAFMSLQELIKLATSAIYVSAMNIGIPDWVGIHWIVDIDGNLCVTPIGNHNVYAGPNNTFKVSDKWPTRPFSGSLIVKQDMISQQFKKRAFNANYIIAAGKYIYPLNEQWTEMRSGDPLSGAAGWTGHYQKWHPPGDPWNPSSNVICCDDDGNNSDNMKPLMPHDVYGLKIINAGNTGPNPPGPECCLLHPFSVDIVGLSSKSNVPKIGFWIAKGAGVGADTLQARFCKAKSDGTPDLANCFTANISIGTSNNIWNWVEFTIGPYSTDFSIMQGSSLDWTEIAFFGIRWESDNTTSASVVWIDYLEVIGSVLRFANDPVHMAQYGCKMMVLKDTLAQTDTLDPADPNNPLAQLCIYELSRQRVDLVTGAVTIPISPTVMAGQIVTLVTDFEPYDVDYRIIQVRHSFSKAGAITELTVTDDVFNSVSMALQADQYGQILKAVDPSNYASKTWASMFATPEVDNDLKALGAPYSSPVLFIGYAQNGYTDPAYGKHRKMLNSTVDVYAYPNSGFVLNYWILDGQNAGSGNGSDHNHIVVTMDKSHTITPLFKVQGLP